MPREYDIIIYGATSTTARFLIPCLEAEPIRLALASRSTAQLPTGLPKIDCPLESIHTLTPRTSLLINCAGPYIFTGEAIVKACINSGTHYMDITGETHFIASILRKYGDEALKRGVAIVNCCGFDSVPADVGVELMKGYFDTVDPNKMNINGVDSNKVDVEGILQFEGVKVNRATWESLVYSLGNVEEMRRCRDEKKRCEKKSMNGCDRNKGCDEKNCVKCVDDKEAVEKNCGYGASSGDKENCGDSVDDKASSDDSVDDKENCDECLDYEAVGSDKKNCCDKASSSDSVDDKKNCGDKAANQSNNSSPVKGKKASGPSERALGSNNPVSGLNPRRAMKSQRIPEWEYDGEMGGYKVKFRGTDASLMRRTQTAMAATGLPTASYMAMLYVGTAWGLLQYLVFGSLLFFMAKLRFTRSLLLKYPAIFSFGLVRVTPPTEKDVASSSFRLILRGHGVKDGVRLKKTIVISGPDPATTTTAIILGQCAMTLLDLGDTRRIFRSGVMTPGMAFHGSNLVEKLKSKGILFIVSDE